MIPARGLAAGLAALALAACAGRPAFEDVTDDPRVTPVQAAAQIDLRRGETVLWGGVVTAEAPAAAGRWLTVRAYALDARRRPDPATPPLGLFRVHVPADTPLPEAAVGRRLTVLGRLADTAVPAGESRPWPVVRGERLQLWAPGRGWGWPDLDIGIGFFFHN